MGIIPRAAQDLFGRDHGDADVVVKLSYLQIYCEQIQDLLKPETGDNMSIREFREGPSVGAGSAGSKATCISSGTFSEGTTASPVSAGESSPPSAGAAGAHPSALAVRSSRVFHALTFLPALLWA